MFNKFKAFCTKPNFGLLLIRVVIGSMFMIHGIPKFLGGFPVLESIGQTMAIFGITAYPVFWGFMAALSEALGGLLMILGWQFRIAMFFLMSVMAVATYSTYLSTHDLHRYGWSLELTAIFLGLMFVGPGRFSIDKS